MSKRTLLLALLVCWSAYATAPRAIQLTDLDGKKVSLASVQRDATLLAFWSVACVPCIEEMPLLEELSRKLASDTHATLIGVNVDDADQVDQIRKVIADQKVTYPMLRDPDETLLRQWFAKSSFPTLVVFDRRMRALATQGYQPGQTPTEFLAEWMPRVADAELGKLRQHLRIVVSKDSGKPVDPARMTATFEKMVRSKHPELSDAEVRKRVDALVVKLKEGGSVVIE